MMKILIKLKIIIILVVKSNKKINNFEKSNSKKILSSRRGLFQYNYKNELTTITEDDNINVLFYKSQNYFNVRRKYMNLNNKENNKTCNNLKIKIIIKIVIIKNFILVKIVIKKLLVILMKKINK